MITMDDARQKAAAWCAAWNSRDLDAIMSHYAEDVAFSSPTVVARWGIADGWLRGKPKLRDNFAVGVNAPDLHFELIDVLLTGPRRLSECLNYAQSFQRPGKF